MKKKIILICSLASSLAYSQVGINTANPQATFHIDGAKDNPTTGAPSVAQQANDFAVTSAGNVGIRVTAPTNTLDVNGTARIRTINQASVGTITSPIYVDPTGVIVKSSVSSTYGNRTSASITLATSGASGSIITGLAQGVYRCTIIIPATPCGDVATVDFLIHNISTNSFYAINGQNGLISTPTTGTGSPTMTRTGRTSVAITWAGVLSCADGGNNTALNYTVTMPSMGTINITNNGNISRTYNIALTKID